jgi:outer membrane PBP1 activator LpoA protein
VNTSASIKQLLVEAETATPLKAAQLKVQAARLMLLQEKFTAVTRLLDTIAVQALPDSLLFKAYLVRAKASIGLAEGNSALLYLTKLTNDSGFSDAQLNDKYTTLASAYGLTNQLNKEVVALISASEFTNDSSELISLNENIWQLFKTLDLQQLKTIGTNANNSYTLRGWLVLIIKFKETPNSEKIIANQWYKSWTAHSAVKFPPQALAGYLSKEPLQNTSYNYSHVVVALPESGKYAKGGAAIIQGIKLAAMSPANNNVQISYIDSARYNSASAILARAQELNADAIIGPINRAIVSQLAQMPALPIPVLALNTTAIGNSNLYQFGLSNEDEVRDAAQRAFKDGRRNILALVPENDSGILAANTFTNAFNSLGGQVLSTSYYDTDKGNVTNAVAQMLKLNQSTIRALQKKVKTAFLRDAIRRMTRKDADGIFLFASKSDAYQIGPSILYFYADNLPLYATSRIFSGKTNPVKDLDLNGMMFGDIPWLLTEGNYKRKMAAVTGKTQTRFGRLYAFGIDALNVAPNLYNLAAQPDSFYDGETGKLKVSADNMLQKTLNWAQFVDGSLKTLPAQ